MMQWFHWYLPPDGTHWRKLQQDVAMLAEAGFRESHVYWETEDEDGEDTGEWERGEDAPSNPSWICYIVAIK